jgi:hypothetical protein
LSDIYAEVTDIKDLKEANIISKLKEKAKDYEKYHIVKYY